MAYYGYQPATGANDSFKVLDDIKSYTLTFDGSSSSVVSAADDTITSNEHRFIHGQKVTYNKGGGGTKIAGLDDGSYYVIIVDTNTIKLSADSGPGDPVNITGVGGGTTHTLNVAFDGTNTKFKPTYDSGTTGQITRAAQLVISLNGVIQQPVDSSSPSSGFGLDGGNIIFSEPPTTADTFWGHILTKNLASFEVSDNKVDNFTGNGSATEFTLSKSPANSDNVIVTIDGVVQYPSTSGNTRAYQVNDNSLVFSSAPADGAAIQARHIGFAGSVPGTSGVTGFYGRTGNVALVNTDNIVANDATFSGNVSIAKTLTYEDVTNIDSVGVVTARTDIHVGENIAHKDDTDTKIVFTDNQLDFQTGGFSRAYLNNWGFYIRSGFGLSFLASDGPSPNIKSGGTDAQDLLLTTGTDNPTRIQIASGGNVGINSTIPEKKLDITGNLQVKDAGGKIGFLVDPATGDFQVNQSVASWTNPGVDPVALLKWGWHGATGNYMYMGSGGNAAPASQMAILVSEEDGFKLGRSAWDGTNGDISATNEFFTVSKTGSVGIGTSVMSKDFEVYRNGLVNAKIKGNVAGGLGAELILQNVNAADNGYTEIQFQDPGTNVFSKIRGFNLTDASNNGYMALYTASATEGLKERVRISDAGKVGIGTEDPIAHLQVYRKTQYASNPIIQARSNNGSTNELKFEIDGDGKAYFNGKVGIKTTGVFNGALLSIGNGQGANIPSGEHTKIAPSANTITFLDSADNASDTGNIQFWNTVYNNCAAKIEFYHAAANLGGIKFYTKPAAGTDPVERLQIDANGNVYVGGVGAGATSGLLWLNDTAANSSKIWQDNGNSALVFGTGSGQAERLRINSTGIATFYQGFSLEAGGAVRFDVSHTSGGNVLVKNPTAANITFQIQSNDDQLQLHNGGNVGMGIGSPSAKLHVRTSAQDVAIFESTNNAPTGPEVFIKHSPGAGNMQHADTIGMLQFQGVDLANNATLYSSIRAIAADVTNTEEKGDLTFWTRRHSDFLERLRIKSDGNVGIGTISPNNPLTIHGSGNHIYLKDTATNNVLQIRHASGVAEFNSFDLDGNARRDFVFNQYTSEALRITSDGYLKLAGTISGSNNKLGRFLMPSHDSGEEDVMYMQFQQEDAFNQLEFGGGSSSYNAATQILFRTAAIDTVTGVERLRITSDGKVAIGGNAQALRLTVRAADSITAGVNEGTISNAIAMFYGGSRNTIVADKEIIDTTIIHIKGQILDTDDTNNSTTGTHSTGKIVFSGRRATGAQSIIESATVWNRASQTAGSELRFYTAPVSNNGGDAAVERLKISNSGYMQMKNSAGSTFALLRNTATETTTDLLGSLDFGTINWDSSTAQISSYQDGAKDKASLRFYTQPSVGDGIQERIRIDNLGKVSIGGNYTATQGQLQVFNGNDFSTDSISTNTDNIWLVSDATSGDGVYGASIGFSRVQYADRRAAAIATRQYGTDEDQVGLSFFIHKDTDAAEPVVEAARITPDGELQTKNRSDQKWGLQVADEYGVWGSNTGLAPTTTRTWTITSSSYGWGRFSLGGGDGNWQRAACVIDYGGVMWSTTKAYYHNEIIKSSSTASISTTYNNDSIVISLTAGSNWFYYTVNLTQGRRDASSWATITQG